MAHSSKMISAPVSMPSDISAVLGITATDLATICRSGVINMWARYKPEGVASGLQTMPIGIMTNAQRKLNGYGIRVNYGSGYGSIARLVQDLRAGTVNSMFEYIKPSGGASSPYRLADFDGYYHSAQAPIYSPYDPNTTLTVNSDGTLQLYFYVSVNGSSSQLGLSDLRVGGDTNSFSNYYFGILIYNNSDYYAATQSHVMGTSWQEGLDVTLTGVSTSPQTYTITPFFSTLPFTTASGSGTGTIFPMNFASSTIKTGNATQWVSISTYVYVWSNDMSTIRLRWSVSNNLSGTFTFSVSPSNSYVTVGSPSQQGTYGSWGISISETVPAHSGRNGDIIIATNILYAQQNFIREGMSNVHIQAAQHSDTYIYNGIVQVWEVD